MKLTLLVFTFCVSFKVHADEIGKHLKLFHGKATTIYGKGELMCGESTPQACSRGATTASGAEFDPNVPMVAIAIPKRLKMRPRVIWVKSAWSRCIAVLLLDKKNPKHAEKTPWDITPKLAKMLQVVSHDKLYLCEE